MSESRPERARHAAPLHGRSALWACAVGLFVAAVVPRLGSALAGYQASNDAAEHLLIARSLARGDGFTLPIRVRDVDGGPAVHEAYGERAPLFPWVLSLVVRAGVGREGWPDPRLQLVGVVLAALCAPVAASVASELARRRGLGRWSATWAAVGAGLVVAWAPGLVRASVHLWAEPLGALLVLSAVRLDLSLDAERRRLGVAFFLGVVGGLARFARPEAWVVVPLLVARAALRVRRQPGRASEVAVLLATLVTVNALGLAVTGVIAPQLFLLGVRHFEDAMGVGATPQGVDLSSVLTAVASNLAGQLEFMLLPKNGWLVVPLAGLFFLRAGRPGDRGPSAWLLVWAAAFVLATAGVWSTSDPYRFTIVPLVLLAPVALVEAETWRAHLRLGRRALAVGLVSLVLVLGHAAGRELRGRGGVPSGGRIAPVEGTPALDDPWSYALVTGRPAVLGRRPTGRSNGGS